MQPESGHRSSHCFPPRRNEYVAAALILSTLVPTATATVYPSNHKLYKFDYHPKSQGYQEPIRPLSKRQNPIPLIVTNSCGDTIWPGLATQSGEGPESSGFELGPGETRNMTVGSSWAGRVWGRTNCTTGDDTATCATGDCFGRLECEFSGQVPVTLAEFTLSGGVTGRQTFYDISLVDGYNLPVGLVYHPAGNTTNIPPNFVNAACIATPGYLMAPNRTGTYYTNSSFPMPYDTSQTNGGIADWCPWDLQAFPPSKPGDGIFPYPDDQIQRPVFDPCKSACASTNDPSACCTGKYDDPNVCKRSNYANAAKTICPDAYSFAYDDQTSTFIIPSGGGWEVVFCPEGRSTDILSTFGAQLQQIASSGQVTDQVKDTAMNLTYIESRPSGAANLKMPNLLAGVVAAVVAVVAAITL
ncbi:thaumatin family protein [Pseudomassariella vexata]|uniref:Thaumatin family protein n=1 Tax=Pseudomassariella vexata TaxID=1141098 RepID=A0A1Y2E7N3_9PEZI|nr:thaumatin family protein [Pseudomassariella vexata]ORY67334.1 thaumatin family protein [Pseudomassariella vexata]